MGMSAENDNVSFAEQQEIKKREAAKKAAEQKIPSYSMMGAIQIKGKKYQLLIGEDKKWYKSEWLRDERFDDMNRTPLVDVYSSEITPLTKEEFESYFSQKKPVKGRKKS